MHQPIVTAEVPLISVARSPAHRTTKTTERHAHLAPERFSNEMPRRVESWPGNGEF